MKHILFQLIHPDNVFNDDVDVCSVCVYVDDLNLYIMRIICESHEWIQRNHKTDHDAFVVNVSVCTCVCVRICVFNMIKGNANVTINVCILLLFSCTI